MYWIYKCTGYTMYQIHNVPDIQFSEYTYTIVVVYIKSGVLMHWAIMVTPCMNSSTSNLMIVDV